jgi:hypothetical protein
VPQPTRYIIAPQNYLAHSGLGRVRLRYLGEEQDYLDIGYRRELSRDIVLSVQIFGPKREEGTGGYTKLDNEELSNLHFPPNDVEVIKGRRMRWAGHVVRMLKMTRDVHDDSQNILSGG